MSGKRFVSLSKAIERMEAGQVKYYRNAGVPNLGIPEGRYQLQTMEYGRPHSITCYDVQFRTKVSIPMGFKWAPYSHETNGAGIN